MESSSALFDLATLYYACRDTDSLLNTFAARLGGLLGARAVLVWLRDDGQEGLVCRSQWFEPGERFEVSTETVAGGILSDVFGDVAALRISAAEMEPQQLLHLEEGQRERVKSAMYISLPGAAGAAGVLEALNSRRGEFTPDQLSFAQEACRITGLALENRLALEKDQRSQLATVERLTALYDLSRIFNSTLELEELLPIVADKIRDILGAQACNLWLVDPDANELYGAHQAGEDPTTSEGARCPMGQGVLGEAAQSGQPRLVEDPEEEESLEARRKAGEEFKIQTLMCAPLLKGEEVLGVVEVVNKLDGTPFTEEDLFFLSSLCEQAAIALHNANLLESERKVHVLDALLSISQEITSTLDLDHVLTAVVHHAAKVVPFDRCAIGFLDRGRFRLGAVSGEAEVPKSREMDQLRELMAWTAEQESAVAADLYDDGWHLQPEEARAEAVSFLEAHEYNGFYSLPLRDDQGTLGALALLSGNADFLTESQKETLSILANQTTVAIRNAQLYQQVPLANLLKPLAEKKQKLFRAVPRARWLEYAWKAAAVAAVLAIVPWPMRIETNATVVPAERRVVSAEVGGVVKQVLVREGESVNQGQLLAQLDDSDARVKLAQAETNLAITRQNLADAEFHRDFAATGQARLQTELYQAELTLEQQKVEEAQLRAPISGVVVTPKVEQKVGLALQPGDRFCELVNQGRMAVEMNVPETDVALIRPGTHVALKLNAFPTLTLAGRVQQIGAQTLTEEGRQFFVVRALFENSGNQARDGMVGHGKIMAGGGWLGSGWYPIGYVMFRSLARWAWEKVWSWLP